MNSTEHTNSHSASYGMYIMVWAGLIAFTAVTITLAGINLGGLTLIVALLIASTKTVLVVNYFMHVKFDNIVIKVFIGLCLLVFIILLALTFSDLSFR